MEQELTYISTRKAAKLLGMQQGGLRKILREEPDEEGEKKLESTIFVVNQKPRHFIEKEDFLQFLNKRITKLESELETNKTALETHKTAQAIIIEEIRHDR